MLSRRVISVLALGALTVGFAVVARRRQQKSQKKLVSTRRRKDIKVQPAGEKVPEKGETARQLDRTAASTAAAKEGPKENLVVPEDEDQAPDLHGHTTSSLSPEGPQHQRSSTQRSCQALAGPHHDDEDSPALLQRDSQHVSATEGGRQRNRQEEEDTIASPLVSVMTSSSLAARRAPRTGSLPPTTAIPPTIETSALELRRPVSPDEEKQNPSIYEGATQRLPHQQEQREERGDRGEVAVPAAEMEHLAREPEHELLRLCASVSLPHEEGKVEQGPRQSSEVSSNTYGIERRDDDALSSSSLPPGPQQAEAAIQVLQETEEQEAAEEDSAIPAILQVNELLTTSSSAPSPASLSEARPKNEETSLCGAHSSLPVLANVPEHLSAKSSPDASPSARMRSSEEEDGHPPSVHEEHVARAIEQEEVQEQEEQQGVQGRIEEEIAGLLNNLEIDSETTDSLVEEDRDTSDFLLQSEASGTAKQETYRSTDQAEQSTINTADSSSMPTEPWAMEQHEEEERSAAGTTAQQQMPTDYLFALVEIFDAKEELPEPSEQVIGQESEFSPLGLQLTPELTQGGSEEKEAGAIKPEGHSSSCQLEEKGFEDQSREHYMEETAGNEPVRSERSSSNSSQEEENEEMRPQEQEVSLLEPSTEEQAEPPVLLSDASDAPDASDEEQEEQEASELFNAAAEPFVLEQGVVMTPSVALKSILALQPPRLQVAGSHQSVTSARALSSPPLPEAVRAAVPVQNYFSALSEEPSASSASSCAAASDSGGEEQRQAPQREEEELEESLAPTPVPSSSSDAHDSEGEEKDHEDEEPACSCSESVLSSEEAGECFPDSSAAAEAQYFQQFSKTMERKEGEEEDESELQGEAMEFEAGEHGLTMKLAAEEEEEEAEELPASVSALPPVTEENLSPPPTVPLSPSPEPFIFSSPEEELRGERREGQGRTCTIFEEEELYIHPHYVTFGEITVPLLKAPPVERQEKEAAPHTSSQGDERCQVLTHRLERRISLQKTTGDLDDCEAARTVVASQGTSSLSVLEQIKTEETERGEHDRGKICQEAPEAKSQQEVEATLQEEDREKSSGEKRRLSDKMGSEDGFQASFLSLPSSRSVDRRSYSHTDDEATEANDEETCILISGVFFIEEPSSELVVEEKRDEGDQHLEPGSLREEERELEEEGNSKQALPLPPIALDRRAQEGVHLAAPEELGQDRYMVGHRFLAGAKKKEEEEGNKDEGRGAKREEEDEESLSMDLSTFLFEPHGAVTLGRPSTPLAAQSMEPDDGLKTTKKTENSQQALGRSSSIQPAEEGEMVPEEQEMSAFFLESSGEKREQGKREDGRCRRETKERDEEDGDWHQLSPSDSVDREAMALHGKLSWPESSSPSSASEDDQEQGHELLLSREESDIIQRTRTRDDEVYTEGKAEVEEKVDLHKEEEELSLNDSSSRVMEVSEGQLAVHCDDAEAESIEEEDGDEEEGQHNSEKDEGGGSEEEQEASQKESDHASETGSLPVFKIQIPERAHEGEEESLSSCLASSKVVETSTSLRPLLGEPQEDYLADDERADITWWMPQSPGNQREGTSSEGGTVEGGAKPVQSVEALAAEEGALLLRMVEEAVTDDVDLGACQQKDDTTSDQGMCQEEKALDDPRRWLAEKEELSVFEERRAQEREARDEATQQDEGDFTYKTEDGAGLPSMTLEEKAEEARATGEAREEMVQLIAEGYLCSPDRCSTMSDEEISDKEASPLREEERQDMGDEGSLSLRPNFRPILSLSYPFSSFVEPVGTDEEEEYREQWEDQEDNDDKATVAPGQKRETDGEETNNAIMDETPVAMADSTPEPQLESEERQKAEVCADEKTTETDAGEQGLSTWIPETRCATHTLEEGLCTWEAGTDEQGAASDGKIDSDPMKREDGTEEPETTSADGRESTSFSVEMRLQENSGGAIVTAPGQDEVDLSASMETAPASFSSHSNLQEREHTSAIAGGLQGQDTEDDKEVTLLTPSSSGKSGSEEQDGEETLASLNLADGTVVEGGSDVMLGLAQLFDDESDIITGASDTLPAASPAQEEDHQHQEEAEDPEENADDSTASLIKLDEEEEEKKQVEGSMSQQEREFSSTIEGIIQAKKQPRLMDADEDILNQEGDECPPHDLSKEGIRDADQSCASAMDQVEIKSNMNLRSSGSPVAEERGRQDAEMYSRNLPSMQTAVSDSDSATSTKAMEEQELKEEEKDANQRQEFVKVQSGVREKTTGDEGPEERESSTGKEEHVESASQKEHEDQHVDELTLLPSFLAEMYR